MFCRATRASLGTRCSAASQTSGFAAASGQYLPDDVAQGFLDFVESVAPTTAVPAHGTATRLYYLIFGEVAPLPSAVCQNHRHQFRFARHAPFERARHL